MVDIKDPAYLYIDNPEREDYGQTIEMEFEDFKKNAKELKAMGIRPATGEELAPVQRKMQRKMAAEEPGTAAAMGALSGATFGTAPAALKKLGVIDDMQALQDLKEENPNAYRAGEVGGVVATSLAGGGAGLLSRGAGGIAAKTLPQTALRTGLYSGAQSAGSEFADQTIKEEGYDVGKIAEEGGTGLATGAVLPVAGALGSKVVGGATSSLIDKIPGTGHTLGRVADKISGYAPAVATGLATDYLIDRKFDPLQAILFAAGAKGAGRTLPSGAKITEGSMRVASGLSKGKDIVSGAIDRLRELNPGLGYRDAAKLVEALRKRAAEGNLSVADQEAYYGED